MCVTEMVDSKAGSGNVKGECYMLNLRHYQLLLESCQMEGTL